jgi:tetratricopeptide (TPR) repeat protein
VEGQNLLRARRILKEELSSLRRTAVRESSAGDHENAPSPYLLLKEPMATGAANLLSDLGGVYQRLGQESEALAVLEEAAELLRAIHGDKDPRHGMAADKHADALVQNGHHSQAAAIYRRLLDTMAINLGRNHPGYQLTLSKHANAASAAGKHGMAAKAYAEMLELYGAATKAAGSSDMDGGKDAVDPSGQEEASIRVQYARALAGATRYDDALREAVRARDAFAASTAAGSLEHAASINGVGGVLEKLGRDEEAVKAMGEAYQIARKAVDATPSDVAQAKKNLEGLKAHVRRKSRRRQDRSQSAVKPKDDL